jgi:hypothetical protein
MTLSLIDQIQKPQLDAFHASIDAVLKQVEKFSLPGEPYSDQALSLLQLEITKINILISAFKRKTQVKSEHTQVSLKLLETKVTHGSSLIALIPLMHIITPSHSLSLSPNQEEAMKTLASLKGKIEGLTIDSKTLQSKFTTARGELIEFAADKTRFEIHLGQIESYPADFVASELFLNSKRMELRDSITIVSNKIEKKRKEVALLGEKLSTAKNELTTATRDFQNIFVQEKDPVVRGCFKGFASSLE